LTSYSRVSNSNSTTRHQPSSPPMKATERLGESVVMIPRPPRSSQTRLPSPVPACRQHPLCSLFGEYSTLSVFLCPPPPEVQLSMEECPRHSYNFSAFTFSFLYPFRAPYDLCINSPLSVRFLQVFAAILMAPPRADFECLKYVSSFTRPGPHFCSSFHSGTMLSGKVGPFCSFSRRSRTLAPDRLPRQDSP